MCIWFSSKRNLHLTSSQLEINPQLPARYCCMSLMWSICSALLPLVCMFGNDLQLYFGPGCSNGCSWDGRNREKGNEKEHFGGKLSKCTLHFPSKTEQQQKLVLAEAMSGPDGKSKVRGASSIICVASFDVIDKLIDLHQTYGIWNIWHIFLVVAMV
jgi:hypothetical protein